MGFMTHQEEYLRNVIPLRKLYNSVFGNNDSEAIQKMQDSLKERVDKLHIDIIEGKVLTTLDKGYKEQYKNNKEYRDRLIKSNNSKELIVSAINYMEDLQPNQYECEGYV